MKILVAAAFALGLAGCAATEVDTYRAEKPVLDIQKYLNGTLDAWGIFQGRSGEVKKRFHVVIDAKWNGDIGTLDEHFSWSDGTTSRRVWTLTKQADGTFIGTAHDVIGEAKGEASGNALHWRYVLALPVNGRVYNVTMDDWMFMLDDKVMMNRTTMSKFGFRVGELSITFVKR